MYFPYKRNTNDLAEVEQVIDLKINAVFRSIKTHEVPMKLMELKVEVFRQEVEANFDGPLSTREATSDMLVKNLEEEENKKKFAERLENFIRFIVPASEITSMTGDITEGFYKLKNKKNVAFAVLWLVNQIVINILRRF